MKSRSYFLSNCLAVVVTALFLGGCNSSSVKDFEGRVIEQGAIYNATVCLDANGNFICDEGEAVTKTDEDGRYSFKNKGKYRGTILVKIDSDSVNYETGKKLKYKNYFLSNYQNPVVSIYTTFAYLLKEYGSYSTMEAAGEYLSNKLFNKQTSLILNDYAMEDDSDLETGAVFLIRWLGIKLEWMRFPYDENPDIAACNKEIYETIVSQIDDISGHIESLNLSLNASVQSDLLSNKIMTSPLKAASTLYGIESNTSEDASSGGEDNSYDIYEWIEGMEYGRGFTDVSNQIIQGSNCVEGYTKNWYGSSKTNYQFTLIQSEEDLSKNLNINGRISLSYDLVSGSLSGQYINTYKSNESSVFMLISYEAQTGTWNVDNAKLTDSAQDLYENDRDKFRQQCGDKFLVSATFGGRFLGLLEIKTSSISEKKDIEASLKGSYNAEVTKVDVEGNFNQIMDGLSQSYNISVHVGTQGGEMVSIEVTDLASLEDEANSFITDTQSGCTSDSNECYYQATFAKYEEIASNGEEISDTVKKQKEMIALYDEAVAKYENLKPNIDFIRNHPDLFEAKYQTSTFLQTTYNNIHLAQTNVESHASICESKGTCDLVSSFNSGKSPEEIEATMPAMDLLAVESCEEYQNYYYQSLDKANVMLYINRDLNKNFDAYCDGSVTYLPLTKHSNSVIYPRNNYFRAQHLTSDSDDDPVSLITMYSRLKVDVQGDTLLIDSQDSTYSHTYKIPFSSDTDISTLYFDDDYYGPLYLSSVPFGSVYNLPCPQAYETITHNINFEYVPTQLSWNDADAYAKANDSVLATVLNTEDQLGIEAAFNDAGGSGKFWIGLKYDTQVYNPPSRPRPAPPVYYTVNGNYVNPADGYSNFIQPYPRNNSFDPYYTLVSYGYADPDQNFQWNLTYDQNLKLPFVIKYNTPKTVTEQIPVQGECNNFSEYGNINLNGTNFKISDDNVYGYFDSTQITTDTSGQSITFKDQSPDSNEKWSVQAGDVELIYISD